MNQPRSGLVQGFTCLLASWVAAMAWETTATARPAGGGHQSAAVGTIQGMGLPRSGLPYQAGQPTLPRSLDSQVSTLSRQFRLERLTDASGKIFDIVPPVPPDLAPESPLPGYRLVRLGRKHNNRLCFAATIGGTKGLIMLDTGATNTALNETTYRSLRLGGAAALPGGVPRALSINGVNVPVAQAPDFRVGRSNLGTVPVCLIKRDYLRDGRGDAGQSYDGLLGQNILRHYRALVDCTRLMLYLNLDPSKKINLSASFAHHGWTRVPMIDTGSHFLVPCVLNGRRFRLVVDTGAPFTNLDRSLLDEAKVPSHALPLRGNLIGMRSEPVSLVDVDHIQIGDHVAKDVHMTATSQSLAAFAGRNDRTPGVPVVGLLGGDLLARNGAIIDFGNQVLYLKSVGNSPPSDSRRAKP